MTEVKCMNVDGELKCGKKKHHSDDDDDHHGKDKDKGTKTVKLIKQQDTCHVAWQRRRPLHIAVDATAATS